MVIKTIRASSTQDLVYHELFKAIMAGVIAPGERVTLEGLAKQLNVSVMPVREAIKRLEAGGFVVVNNRRIIANKLSAENVRNILETRIVLEGYAAEKASIQRSESTIEKLEKSLARMKNAKDIRIFYEANQKFHNSIYHEAGVPIMMEVIDSLRIRYSPYVHIIFESAPDWDSLPFITSHQKIIEGMRLKDPIKVRKWLEKDLTDAANIIVKLLERQP